jgi:hypothetical protein
VAKYSGIQKEHQLKNRVFDDYFDSNKCGWDTATDKASKTPIDFIVTNPKTRSDLFADGTQAASVHHLWGEVKKGTHDVFALFTQLLLTCKKTYDKGDHLAPPWLCCFDEARIAFVPFHEVLPIFNVTDINWTQTPSNHDTKDFEKARAQVQNCIGAKIIVFNFGDGDSDIRAFVKTHIGVEGAAGIKSPITKENFVQVFIKWVKEVKPTINIPKNEWADFKRNGILDCDFFRADLMSEGGNTITEKLKIILRNDNYKLREKIKDRLFTSDIGFNDGGAAYQRFWNRYERPPAKVYRQHIIDRRDLLVPVNIREFKGSFFTPAIWADKSKEYIARVFGKNWQEEYYVWDCAAGTGNLLAGLSNPYNVWASDIDEGNVETMQSLIDIDDNLNLLPAHVFRFDFLNDSFDKLPEGLRDIINDPEKRKRLIVYINPPYAEATNARTVTGTGENRVEVARLHQTKERFQSLIGAATNELFTQFFARVFADINGAKLAAFSTFKFVCAGHFIKFRRFFNAEYKAGFAVQSNTFDNVKGKFPIGFTIWDLNGKKFPASIRVNIPEFGGTKTFWDGFEKSINRWIKQYDTKSLPGIGFMGNYAPDFQMIHQPYIEVQKGTHHVNYFSFNERNLIEGCMYFAVRLAIAKTWLNASDQFYYPKKDGWQTDTAFQNNCLVFTLFHGKNYISCNDDETQNGTSCVNHWIPFTEKQVGAKEKFASNFMSGFLAKRGIGNGEQGTGGSSEALAVYDAGLALWKYYHAKINVGALHATPQQGAPCPNGNSVNASFYDIRAFFQGRDDNGKMNPASADDTYNALIKTLRDALKTLAERIQPKVYAYGFLKE